MAGPLGHTVEIVSVPSADGRWIRRVRVLGISGCAVESTDLDVSADIERVLALSAQRLSDGVTTEPGRSRPLRPDLDVVTGFYRGGLP
ncbi:hypothetical protein ACN27F_33595 [Solwaraspora sp. WMMB335]|uniref:hypothetical protein n=1 Tax=Solwaraspora sp. WMMB335 TaxID=3404118 RepID=UPI003B93D0AA